MGEDPASVSDVFIGRDEELMELRAALRAAATGAGSVRLLAGEPGIGKTRLAREVATLAEADGFAVGWGRTWEAGGAPPFWPWTRALRDLLRGHPDEDVRDALRRWPAATALLPELAQELGQPVFDGGAGGSTQERFAVFEAVSTLLSELARRRPAMLVFEDVHAADEPSLLLLQFVAADVRAARVLVLATFRDVEARQDVRRAARVGELARQAGTISLTGLTPAQTRSLLASRAPDTADATFVTQVQEATSGNPFFIEELLRLRRSAAAGSSGIPLGARETVRSRLALVPPQTYAVVVTAAVYGRAFDEQVLARILDQRPEQVSDLLRPAVDAALVVRDGDELRFRHGLIREVLVDETPAADRARLHARVVEVLEALPPMARERHLAELAHHAVRAVSGNAEQAIVHARNAGDAAMRALAFEEAVRQYEDALEVTALTQDSDQVVLDLLVALVEARAGAGDLAAARATALEVRERAQALGATGHLAQAALAYPSMSAAVWRVDEDHLALLRGALDALGERGDAATRVRLLCSLVVESYFSRAPLGELVDEAVRLAETSGDPVAIAQSYYISHYKNRGPAPDPAELERDRSVELARRAGDTHLEARVLLWRIGAWMELGQLGHLEADIVEYDRLVERTRRPIDVWWGKVMQAMLLTREGSFEAAQQAVQDAVDYGYRFAGVQALSIFGAQDYLVRLDRTPWVDIQAQLLALPDDFRQRLPVRSSLVRTRAALGQHARARAELADFAAEGYQLLPRDRSRLTCLALLCEAAADVQDLVRAEELLDLTEPYSGLLVVAPPFADFGPVDLHRGRLLHLVGRHDDAAAAYTAALRLCERTGGRPDAVRTRLHHARLLASTGETDVARRLFAQARDDAAALDMPLLAEAAQAGLDAVAPPPEPQQPAPVAVQVACEGEYWSIRYGDNAVRLRDSKGLHYLSRLICSPGKEIHALELTAARLSGAAAAPVHDLHVAVDDLGPVLDERAKAEYRRRIQELRREADEATEAGDPERAARARQEHDVFVTELSRALGLHGRDRRTGSVAEQARINVSKAVRNAIRRVQEQDAELGAELEAAVRTGLFCSYLPLSGQRRWEVAGRA